MKKLFYLLAITFSCSSFGQNLTTNYEIGYFVDYNKQLINGYSDFDYEPKTPLKVSYQASENFAKGYYFDTEGAKVNGLLKYSQSDRDLKFKLDEKDIEKSIKAEESKGYIIGIDTFSVVKNVTILGFFGDKLSKNSEFAANMESIGGMKFYKFSANATNGDPYVKYIVKKSETSDFVTFPSTTSGPFSVNDKFKNLTVEVFGDDSILKRDIENDKYKADDIPSLIKRYKYRKLFNKGQNIYYNSSRDETNIANEGMYYSKIESVQDSVFHLSHFFKNSVKIYDGDFTSFYPHRKQGDFLFYFPNGKIRRKVTYNPKVKKVIDFFENEKPHRDYDVSKNGTVTYKEVYNADNVNIFDENGSGEEEFFDNNTARKITYSYEDKKLKSAYYIDVNGEKVYQLCDKNAEIKKIKDLQKLIKDSLKYPVESLQKNNHGLVLIKCIVEPSGLVSDIKVIKGLDLDCDKAVLDFLNCFRHESYWKPGKVDSELVRQEIILPIEFSIETTSCYRNNYYDYWFFQNMMIQQQMMMQNMMRTSMGR